MRAAEALIAVAIYDDAMSRLYYAAFHAASAALLVLGVEATTHRGLMGLFSMHLVKPGLVSPDAGRSLAILEGLRNQADYNRHFSTDEKGAREERDRAHALLAELEAFVRARGAGIAD